MDDRLFRNAMGNFATGITVITTEVNGEAYGMTANAFVSVSLNPKLVLVSIDHRANMLGQIRQADKFSVSLLMSNQQDVSKRFAGQLKENTPYEFDQFKGMPVVKGALANISCTVYKEVEVGDHTLFIGEVTDLRLNEGDPLLFFQGKYRELETAQQVVEL